MNEAVEAGPGQSRLQWRVLIGFVLGPMMEEHLRRAMLLSRGDPMVFIQRPISATMLAIGAIALIAMLMPNIRKGKDKALQE